MLLLILFRKISLVVIELRFRFTHTSLTHHESKFVMCGNKITKITGKAISTRKLLIRRCKMIILLFCKLPNLQAVPLRTISKCDGQLMFSQEFFNDEAGCFIN